MRLQGHCFGEVVADVTAHPSIDVGVRAFAEARAARLEVGMALALGCGDGGGWL